MNDWPTVLVGSVCAVGLKLAGHLVPARWLAGPRLAAVARLMPAALLAALVTVQAVTTSGHLVIDARIVALGVAALLLRLRAPFMIVVLAAAITAAAVRALGWG